MLETEDFCDVSFRVGSDGHVMRAHRYVLVSRSCVFHAMFCGQMAEQGEITIPDIEAVVFQDFLRFLYTDKAVLTFENAPGLLYTSRKYDVDALFTQCASFLENSLTEENVCEVLENCHGYREVAIEEKALKILTKSREITLKSPCFKKLCRSCFEKFLASDDLRVHEDDVFETTLTWAKERCVEENLEPSSENQRKVLGNLIYQIRFLAFSINFLTTTVRKSQILTTEERILFIDKENNLDIDITPFSSNQRNRSRTCKTNHYVSRFRKGWAANDGYSSSNKQDSVVFTVSKDVNLVGCQIYGSVCNTESDYDVTVSLHNQQRFISEAYKSALVFLKGKCELGEVIFPEPVQINAGQKYTLYLMLYGNHCNWGSDGAKTVEVEDVTFNFMKSDLIEAHSRTDAEIGQIPSLIWRHCS